jgi:hypothetical protein
MIFNASDMEMVLTALRAQVEFWETAPANAQLRREQQASWQALLDKAEAMSEGG